MAENEKLEQTSKADKAKKDKKSDKNAKPGFFARIGARPEVTFIELKSE